MKRIIYIFTLMLLGSTMIFTSCGDKGTDDPEPTKTLDKSKLYDKDWYSQGSTITHYFYSDGKYGNTGSWQWLNNADSMEIVPYAGGNIELWYFNYCIDNEMSCKNGKNGGDIIFKTSPW